MLLSRYQSERTAQTYNGVTTSYLNSGGSVLQEWVTGQPRTNFMYTPGAGGPIFRANSAGLGEWYHYDAAGSVRAVSDASRLAQNTYASGSPKRASGAVSVRYQVSGPRLRVKRLYVTLANFPATHGQGIGGAGRYGPLQGFGRWQISG